MELIPKMLYDFSALKENNSIEKHKIKRKMGKTTINETYQMNANYLKQVIAMPYEIQRYYMEKQKCDNNNTRERKWEK